MGARPPRLPGRLCGFTSDGNLQGAVNTVRSNELRSDAEIADEVKVGESATGDLPFELSFGSDFDTLFEHALRSTFSAASATTGSTTLDVDDATTFSRAAGSFLTNGFEYGMIFDSTGFTDAANNGTFTIREVTATTITIQEGGLVVESGGGDEQIAAVGQHLTAGIVKDSLSIEKTHELGGTDAYFRYEGCRVGGMNITVAAENLVTGSFPVLGLGEVTDTAIVSGATYTAANTAQVMSAADNLATGFRSNAGPFFYQNLQFSLTNNLRAQPAIGQVRAAGIGYGRREITGTMTAYFENLNHYNESVNNTVGGLSFRCGDTTNWYNFVFPRVRFTTRDAFATGNNTDIVTNLGFTATFDSDVGASVRIDKSS